MGRTDEKNLIVGVALPEELLIYSDDLDEVVKKYGLMVGTCFHHEHSYEPHDAVIGVKLDGADYTNIMSATIEEVKIAMDKFTKLFNESFIRELPSLIDIEDIEPLLDLLDEMPRVYVTHYVM